MALAKSLSDYAQLVGEDAKKVASWKKAFLGNSLRDAKGAHAKVLNELRAKPRSPEADSHYRKDADNILAMFTKALHTVNSKFTRDSGHELGRSFMDEHMKHWDPEMFADGQTKADYGPNLLDPLFDVCGKADSTYQEFWRRFDKKWDFGSMNVTLDSLIPENMEHEITSGDTHINIEWLKDVHDKGLDVAMANYHQRLEALAHKIPKVDPGRSLHSVMVGLSTLRNMAKEKKDEWTMNFANSLMHQKHMSDKQRSILDQKLVDYGIPPVNYSLRA